jgi:hypothetical protein
MQNSSTSRRSAPYRANQQSLSVNLVGKPGFSDKIHLKAAEDRARLRERGAANPLDLRDHILRKPDATNQILKARIVAEGIKDGVHL